MDTANAPAIKAFLGTSYTLNAYSTPDEFDIKTLMDLFGDNAIQRFSKNCLLVHFGDAQKLFLFQFGSAVFLNVPLDEHKSHLLRLGFSEEAIVASRDTDEFSRDEFTLTIRPDQTAVSFYSVVLPSFDLEMIQLVALMLARSSALDLIEQEVGQFLKRSEEQVLVIQSGGVLKGSRRNLIKFLGEGLATRHRIVDQLGVFNHPERLWDKEDQYKLYLELHENFEIKKRLDDIEKMTDLSAEVSQLLLEIVNANRGEILELIIILLISVELIRPIIAYLLPG